MIVKTISRYGELYIRVSDLVAYFARDLADAQKKKISNEVKGYISYLIDDLSKHQDERLNSL